MVKNKFHRLVQIGEKRRIWFFNQDFEWVFRGLQQGFHQGYSPFSSASRSASRLSTAAPATFWALTYTGWLRTVLGSWTLWGT
jgi:hypothetical protein